MLIIMLIGLTCSGVYTLAVAIPALCTKRLITVPEYLVSHSIYVNAMPFFLPLVNVFLVVYVSIGLLYKIKHIYQISE